MAEGWVDTAALTWLHWTVIGLAFITAGVHLGLGVSFLPHVMGFAFLLAAAGFLAGIALIVLARRRPLVYALGVPFTATQIVLWYVLNDFPGVAEISPVEAIDKIAQGLLIVLLVVLYRRETS